MADIERTLKSLEIRINTFSLETEKLTTETRTLSSRLNMLRDERAWESIHGKSGTEFIVLSVVIITSVITIGAQFLW